MLFYFKNIILFLLVLVLGGNAYGQLFKLASTISDLASPVSCLAWSVEQNLLVAGDSDGTLDFRDPISGQIVRTEKVFNSAVDHISFNSTGGLMLVSTRTGEIKIYDFVKEKFIQSLYSPEYAGIRFALFSIADGFIYFNGQGRLYKTRSDLTQPVEKVYECDSVIANAVITDDRNAFIFSCGNAVKVLNTRTDQITQEFITSPANIERLALTGNKLVSWSADGTIVFRKYELNQLSADPFLWFKAGTCSKLAFSHDGSLMVTGNTGTWARIWKPLERDVIQELFGHKKEVTNFVFSADDQTLFTAGNDKTINVWKQKPEEQKVIPLILPETVNQPAVNTRSGDSLPVIELNYENIPTHVGGRKVEKTSVVEVNDSTIDIYVFDNSTLDGDVMSLSFQNQWLLTHYEVTKQKKKITLRLIPGSNNYMVLFADNLGKTPPNTAAISFNSKGRERIFRLESDLKTCRAINFIYKNK